jgi:hypothetical protein
MNHCYECGGDIDDDRHFCDMDCANMYKKRHGDKFLFQLSKQTRLRNANNIPVHKKIKGEIVEGSICLFVPPKTSEPKDIDVTKYTHKEHPYVS